MKQSVFLLAFAGMLALSGPLIAEAQKHAKKAPAAASAQKLPCPRAAYENDPVCADAPDEHTLPTPSMKSAAPPRAPVEAVKIGAQWQASSPITTPTPRLVDPAGSDFYRRNTPPDSHGGVGLDMHF